jgi:hypothetical protein
MKSPIEFALVAAIPAEAANFLFAGFPIDTGFPADTSWYVKLIAYQWLYLHWWGWLLVFKIDDAGFEKLIVHGKLGDFILLVSGYLDTVLLILAGIFVLRYGRYLARKYSAGRN